MTVFNETKTCLSCGKQLKGRVDKKFCDDYCRNNYNNLQKAKGSHSSYVRNINNTLLKNRKILESIEGKLVNRSYTDKDGIKKYITEVQVSELLMLGAKTTEA